MASSNAAFTGVISIVFFAAVRVFMLVFNTVVVAELDSGLRGGSPAAKGSRIAMSQDGEGWSRWRVEDRWLGNAIYTCPHIENGPGRPT